jgi:hypothetical protein
VATVNDFPASQLTAGAGQGSTAFASIDPRRVDLTGGGQSSPAFAATDPRLVGITEPAAESTTAASSANANGGIGTPKPTQTTQTVSNNPLHDYESYTYTISWHILSSSQYNDLMANPGTTFVPQNCLMASGGKKGPSFKRNVAFNEDFYIDDFKFTSVINTTNKSKTSNVIDFSFTVIEPNGFTLINRLAAACTSVNGTNYLKQPYLIMIEFQGYKDGVPTGPIPNQTKHLPMALVGMTSKITAKGAEYKIDGVAYNHWAFNEMVAVTPAILSVKAKTVQDLLTQNSATVDPLTQAQMTAAINASTNPTVYYENNGTSSTSAVSPNSGLYAARGLTNGLNAWIASLAASGQIGVPSTYQVVFDAEIGTSDLVIQNNISNAATKDGGANTANGVGVVEFNGSEFTIKAGTNILTVIDYAVRNSKYITDQLIDPSTNNLNVDSLRLKSPLKWYRIIPKVVIKQYDTRTNRYALDVTYYVKPWTVTPKNAHSELGRANGYVKWYDYLFTGQNKDVIDMSIDFDMMFYMQLTADVTKVESQESAPQPANLGATGGAVNQIPNNPYFLPASGHVSQNQTTSVMTGAGQALKMRAADTQRDLTLNSRGDMINLDLKIIGDPQFIKQDDLFYNQNLNVVASQFTPNNSLVTDDGELYVFVNFKSPTDYDDSTGLANPNVGNFQYSAFAGVYKVITVESSFSRGQFIQTLNLVRLLVEDSTKNTALSIASRNDTVLSQSLGQLTPLPSAIFKGPNIIVNQLTSGAAGLNINPAALTSAAGATGLIAGLANQAIGVATNALLKTATQAVTKQLSGLATDLKSSISDFTSGWQTTDSGLNVLSGDVPDTSSVTDLTVPPDLGSAVDLSGLTDVQLGDISGDVFSF